MEVLVTGRLVTGRYLYPRSFVSWKLRLVTGRLETGRLVTGRFVGVTNSQSPEITSEKEYLPAHNSIIPLNW
jgi:hypothetical protein